MGLQFPAGPAPVPGRPLLPEPAWQPHKSTFLSARSHAAAGMGPSSDHLCEIHRGSSAQAIWPQSWHQGPITASTWHGLGGVRVPKTLRPRGCSTALAHPRPQAFG